MKKDWTYKKLGEVAEIKAGFTPSATDLHDNGAIPYYKVSDMNTVGNEVVLTKTSLYTDESKKSFPKGSIVFPKNGAAIATNKKRILGYNSIVDLNTGVCIFDSQVQTKYGYYWFQNIDFRNYTRGGALPTLDIKTLKSKSLPIPPLVDQELIVRELDLLHSVISKKQEQLRELDNLAQAIFYDMFGDPITNPMGWEIKKLGEVCVSELGKTLNQSKDTGVLRPYLCAINISWGRIDITNLKQTRFEDYELDRYSVQKGDLLICEGGDTGRAAIWEKDMPMLYQNALHRVRFNDNVLAVYALYWLHYLKMKGEIDNKYSKGVTIKHLVKSSLLSIPIPLPPLSLQQSFAAKVEAIEAQKQAVQQSIREVEALLAQRMDHYFN